MHVGGSGSGQSHAGTSGQSQGGQSIPSAHAGQAHVVHTQVDPPPEQTSTGLHANPAPQSASAAHDFGENTHSRVTTGSHASGTHGGQSHGSHPASPAGHAHAQGVQAPAQVDVTS